MNASAKLERELARKAPKDLPDEADTLTRVALKFWGDDAPRVLELALERARAVVAAWTPKAPPDADCPRPGGPGAVENVDSGHEKGHESGDRGEGGGVTPSPGLFDALGANPK